MLKSIGTTTSAFQSLSDQSQNWEGKQKLRMKFFICNLQWQKIKLERLKLDALKKVVELELMGKLNPVPVF